jgi:hypothetical protein
MSVEVKIECVFKITNRGQFVIVKPLDSNQNFCITKKSFLGDVELAEFLDIPKSIDENGDQRDIVALQLKYPEDAPRLIPGAVVEIIPGNELHFLQPWYPLSKTDTELILELNKELSRKHILVGKKANAIARRQDNDDVLFELLNDKNKFAVVHLTWTSKIEQGVKYPITQFFENWLDLYNNRIVPDYELFNS